MTNFKASIFDLFAYIIPGMVVILAFVIAINRDIKGIGDLVSSPQKIDLTTSIVFTGLAYVIGFSTYGLGSSLYRKVNKLTWKDSYYDKKSENDTSSSFKWAFIREFSQANFIAINRWAALKGMAQNITIGLVLLAISSSTKFSDHEHLVEWIIVSISCIIMGILLLRRARVYKRYREKDILGTLEVLEYQKKFKAEKKTP